MFVARHSAFLDGSTSIEGHHLLSALLAGDDPAFFSMLANLRVEPETIRTRLAPVPERAADPRQREIPFSPDLKRALETADAEADGTKPRELGAPQLLLGLLATDGCVSTDVMGELDLSVEDLRRAAGRAGYRGR